MALISKVYLGDTKLDLINNDYRDNNRNQT